jgi:hypothetical protein
MSFIFAQGIIRVMVQKILRGLEVFLVLFILSLVTGYSAPSPVDKIEKIRAYTRDGEFNYISWMSNAAVIKLRADSVNAPDIFDRETQKVIVMEYMHVTQSILEAEYQLEQIYADAKITDKEAASKDVRDQLSKLQARHAELAPFAESILQGQVATILAENGLTTAGQPMPSVWYHSTPLPMALIVSPRDRIEQTANISLETDVTVDAQAALESRVDKGLNVSSLVVPIGGVGVYPTMVMRSTNMNWLTTVIAHEWIHNYLTWHPLGFYYMKTPELRTMNETTASIAGDEIGAQVIDRFYPELKPATFSPLELISLPNHLPSLETSRDGFDFRAEMHTTRVGADELLAAGKIEEAEAYMEQRRQIFLKNGYLLRKINQAYFAFYGAYADTPGGAAGEDPVGPAVRALRAQSTSLADFINKIKWMTSFEQLQEATRSAK